MMITEPLWSAGEIARAVAGRTAGRWLADGVAIDSREVIPGDLFVALPGTQRDGHAFVAEALEAGAAGALVSARDLAGIATDDPRLVGVDDTATAFRALATAARQRMSGRVAAVTGSAGKTSVKEALCRALGRDALAHASALSYNNHVGVPLSLARMPRGTRYAVFELGMSAAGEIAPLSRLVAPDVAIVTTVGSAHAAAFADDRAIAAAKAEIFDGMSAGGIAVLNLDHEHAPWLVAQARERGLELLTVSLASEEADVRPLRLKRTVELSCMTADVAGVLATVKVGAPGRHWVTNALLVLAAVRALDGDLGLAGLSLAELQAPAGRGRHCPVPVRDGSFLVIDDAYNANPLSLAAALEALADIPTTPSGRRFAVLADMRELGPRGGDLHRALAPQLRAARLTEVIAVGPQMRLLAETAGVPVTTADDAATALAETRKRVRAGDVVLVKGANAARLHIVVEGLLRLAQAPRPHAHRAGLAAE
ncbi:MAG: UDP-N-acetylmuramoyl-tripeptide--D-alanyl-D-alanine ligase [Rhodothalassiaceae bacterium]